MFNLYLDSADQISVEPLLKTGLFKGVTTNPVILQKSNLTNSDLPQIYRWVSAAGAEQVFFQSWGESSDSIIANAKKILEISPKIIIKVVANEAGIKACKQLSKAGISTLLTAVYSPAQVILADAAGADYIAPYLGKMQDGGLNGFTEVSQMQQILQSSNSKTKILLASVRDLSAIVKMSLVGITDFTISPTVASSLFTDKLSDDAIKVFDQITGK
jgi:transaldolase